MCRICSAALNQIRLALRCRHGEVEDEAVWTRRRLAQFGTLSRSELEAYPIPLTTLPLSSNRPMLSLSSTGALDSELEISNP